ncbi:MAG: TonB-system energizer ExbB [Caldimicrobium sp.]|nr:TonB-system energizer ExbB [Caldimicrobium sp.]MCX7613036.1 TonB-system energizer ExbB [Caldimicrobium sp.]MDW8182413.1 TonB-system energizer ExbB [Caldimicrobium sp.]
MSYFHYLIDYGVIGILILMSIIALAIFLERLKFLKNTDPSTYTSEALLETELTKGLHIIASIGANAPYVGLLGTVLGIMLTFYTIGQEGLIESKKIMVGLALALKATAVGLLVAIPSTIMYNLLLRKVKEKIALYKAQKRQDNYA